MLVALEYVSTNVLLANMSMRTTMMVMMMMMTTTTMMMKEPNELSVGTALLSKS